MPDFEARSVFPGVLKKHMEKNNLSQVDIAKRLNVSKQTVSDWVSGKKFPRVDRMQQLADMFGVLMSELYSPSVTVIEKFPPSDLHLSLNSEEWQLLELYRNADFSAKVYAMEILSNHQKKDTSGKVI